MERITFKPSDLPKPKTRGMSVNIPKDRNRINISLQLSTMLDLKDGDLLEFEISNGELYVRKTISADFGHRVSIQQPKHRAVNIAASVVNRPLTAAIARAMSLPDGAHRLEYTGRVNAGFYIFSK